MCDPARLREILPDDLPVFYRHQLDPVAAAMADFPPRPHEAFMRHWNKILADPAVVKRAVLCGGETAGSIVSWPQDGRRWVGYWLGREFWGQGLATQALAAFLPIVNERPLWAYVSRGNPASRRVLEKCGFRAVEQDEKEILMEWIGETPL